MSDSIQSKLFSLQDLAYQKFHSKLMPNVDPALVIGVRVPALRKLAAELKNTPEAAAFLQELPHTYYEENNLHGLLICASPNLQETLDALNAFLPYVDNWATCDLMHPKAFGTHPDSLPQQIHTWIRSDRTYTVRFGIGMLLTYYLDEHFQPCYLEWAAAVRSEEYYIRMMVAWYFATALAKQRDSALPYLLENKLDAWTHNKTIQKAIESYRISPEDKGFLRTLRRKK